MDDKTVMLTEWDYLTDGGGIVQFSEFVNTTVKGQPAVLAAARADSGALWSLSWTTAAKDYILYVQEPKLAENTAAFMLELANKVSR